MQNAQSEDAIETSLRPLLIPSCTTHRRLFPAKHSFSYSYFFVGIPIGWSGSAGTILAADQNGRIPKRQQTWLSVEAENYLERGSHPEGLQGKLKEYLEGQNVDPQKFKYAYLLTAPRSLGYSFNPISFWYLYDGQKALKAMILEVNNTFDERRMYYLEAAKTESTSNKNDIHPDAEIPPRKKSCGSIFRQTWPKDFHVSPFNDRAGTYSVSATDPFSPANHSNPVIDNTVVLSSPEGQPKLIARVFSTCPPIDPYSLNRLQTISVLLRWSWVGLLTDLRILKEARVLWAVKKLQVFYRPAVHGTSIGRKNTKEEMVIEKVFGAMLQMLADQQGLHFEYVPTAGSEQGKTVNIEAQGGKGESALQVEKQTSRLDIRVLTPEFYGQLVRPATISSVLDSSCFKAAEGQVTLYTSNPNKLQEVFKNMKLTCQRKSKGSELDSRWYFLSLLRSDLTLLQIVAQIIRLYLPGPGNEAKIYSVLSELDQLALLTSSSSDKMASTYTRAAVTILLADRLAWGSVTVLRFLIVTAKVLLVVTLLCLLAWVVQ